MSAKTLILPQLALQKSLGIRLQRGAMAPTLPAENTVFTLKSLQIDKTNKGLRGKRNNIKDRKFINVLQLSY